jgi:hypothetical protein
MDNKNISYMELIQGTISIMIKATRIADIIIIEKMSLIFSKVDCCKNLSTAALATGDVITDEIKEPLSRSTDKNTAIIKRIPIILNIPPFSVITIAIYIRPILIRILIKLFIIKL